jgi:hypothetical protein
MRNNDRYMHLKHRCGGVILLPEGPDVPCPTRASLFISLVYTILVHLLTCNSGVKR